MADDSDYLKEDMIVQSEMGAQDFENLWQIEQKILTGLARRHPFCARVKSRRRIVTRRILPSLDFLIHLINDYIQQFE